MKYFNKICKHIHYIKREMSSFKLSLWENVMFVNSVVTQDKNILINMILSIKKSKSIHLCRNSNDTIKTFIDRLFTKITQQKKKDIYPEKSDILIKINETVVSCNSKCGDIFQENTSNITLHIKDDIFKVVINLPLIKDLKLVLPPHKGLMLYPYAFGKGYNISIKNSTYLWYRIDSNKEFEVGNQFAYVPTEIDINCRLKLVCKPCNDRGQYGPTAEIISSKVEENYVENFPFQNRLKNKLNNSIRIVSYNMLANEYTKTKEAKTEMYPYCSKDLLMPNYRHPLLLTELQSMCFDDLLILCNWKIIYLAYKADIMCLQEVDSYFFNRELSPFLNSMGLNGIFFKKSESKNEGLSCFYSSDKFVLLKSFNIKLNDITTIEMYCGPIDSRDELWNEYLEKKTVLHVLVLKTISDQKNIFLVCNTHLISSPKGDYIRLLQALVELIIINQIKQTLINEYPEYKISTIFCGDFNSTPESGVYELFTELSLSEKFNDVNILSHLKNCIRSEFKMNSAYTLADIEYSNYTNSFVGLLDYIFFTNEYLELLQVLPVPPHEDVIKHIGIPSVLFPSDHIALVADFIIK